jgi:hypothetical protein
LAAKVQRKTETTKEKTGYFQPLYVKKVLLWNTFSLKHFHVRFFMRIFAIKSRSAAPSFTPLFHRQETGK